MNTSAKSPFEWAAFLKNGQADLFQGQGWFKGTLVEIAMPEPGVFLVGSGSDALRVNLEQNSGRPEPDEALAITNDLLAQLQRGYREAGLPSEDLLIRTALARPVRDIVGSILERSTALEKLTATLNMALVRPPKVSMPFPPATSRALMDALGGSPALSRSLFFIDSAEGQLDEEQTWHPLGRRILLGGPRTRSALADRTLDVIEFLSMVSSRNRAATSRGLLSQGRLALSSRGRVVPVSGVREPRHSYDLDLKLRARITGHVDFKFREALIWLLPSSVVEGFMRGVEHASKLLRFGGPTLIVGPFARDWNAIWLGLARVGGTRVWGVQHGGGYGEMAHHPGSDFERIESDLFISAGWVEDEQPTVGACPIRPLPIPRLSQFAQEPVPEGGPRPLVFMFQMTGFDLASLLPGSVGIRGLALRHEELLGLLEPSIRDEALIRIRSPRFEHEGALFESQLGEHGRSLSRSSGPIFDAVATAGLVVIPRLFSTTFLECLAAKKPVLIVDETSEASISRTFFPIYQELRDAGVLFEGVKDAAAAINLIYPGGLQEWWFERRDVLAAASRFMARTAGNLQEMWVEEIIAETRGGPSNWLLPAVREGWD